MALVFDVNDENIREDLRFAPKAISDGFRVVKKDGKTYDPETELRTPTDSLSFTYGENGEFRIWSIRGGWRIARIHEGKFCDHREPVASLLSVLDMVKTYVDEGINILPPKAVTLATIGKSN